MATPSSQTITSESKMVPELRPVMPIDLFNAAIKGNSDVLIQRLGLEPEQQTEILVKIDAFDSTPQQIYTEHQTVQCELQSATRFLGDTVLHLLVTNRHNELALKVFEKDMSLLKAQNKMLETPLYCAAKVGNNEVIEKLIRINSLILKDALNVTNENGDTAMHAAAKNGRDVSCEFLMLDPEVVYKVNNEMLTPFYMAIVKENTNMVLTMLQVDRTLAGTQFSDGMFPIHVAARMGHMSLVKHFFREYPDYAELLDTRGRNVFHFAAEQSKGIIILHLCEIISVGVIARMYDATDYEGNTPEVIARMKGNRSFWRMIDCLPTTIRNNQDLTPDELSSRLRRQLIREHEISEDDDHENMWEQIQVIGLGSVLIITLAFAASFTVPGGYNQDNASNMVVAFGLGLYVTLAPVCFRIAILLLVITLFLGSPALLYVLVSDNIRMVVRIILDKDWTIVAGYMVPLVLIFGLALLSL
ncbi:uncharacterized protein LOC144548352 [Carex rostrata]